MHKLVGVWRINFKEFLRSWCDECICFFQDTFLNFVICNFTRRIIIYFHVSNFVIYFSVWFKMLKYAAKCISLMQSPNIAYMKNKSNNENLYSGHKKPSHNLYSSSWLILKSKDSSLKCSFLHFLNLKRYSS